MNYFVRIQLNTVGLSSPSVQTYAALHHQMDRAGASRTIIGEIPVAQYPYQLPHGEYLMSSNATTAAVRDQVVAITQTLWKDVDVLVIRWEDRAW